MAISGAVTDYLNSRLKALSLERGEARVMNPVTVDIVEKDSDSMPTEPSASVEDGLIEGHKPMQVKFVDAPD